MIKECKECKKICIKCVYYIYRHGITAFPLCKNSEQISMDCVTGGVKTVHIPCFKINYDGNCPDWKTRKESVK